MSGLGIGSASLMNQAGELPWGLWTRQVIAILRLEIKKRQLGRKALIVYLLVGAPAFLFFLRTMVNIPEDAVQSLGRLNVIFAVIFRTFFLRLILFFGCVGIFGQLFRGDMLEKTIH